MENLKDKVIGSLVGGAVGDALGYPIEFIFSYQEIAQRCANGGIFEYVKGFCGGDGKAQISDDTQMTLYTAEGLLYAMKHSAPIVSTIRDAYLRWLGPQVGMDIQGSFPSKLGDIAELNQNRAPGNTCISALMSIYHGNGVDNDSKGCGGIMRIAPIALYGAGHGWTLEQTAKLAGDVAEITHLHPLSTLASACCAAIIQQCILTDECKTVEGFKMIVAAALRCIEKIYPTTTSLTEFCELINKALAMADSPLADWQVIELHLGGGWVAEETLAIAVFSVVRHIDSFEDCVVCAVSHGGDSDSTGAVAGNIIGAILGRKAIPTKFTDTLQLLELIEGMAKYI